MSFLEWDPKYSVNVPQLDKEHQTLLVMVNELHSAMKIGKGKEITEKLINQCVNYAQQHFQNEEKFMLQCKYADFDEHKKQHQLFVERVTELKKELTKNNFVLSSSMLQFLKSWFINHVVMVDKKYSVTINGCKIS